MFLKNIRGDNYLSDTIQPQLGLTKKVRTGVLLVAFASLVAPFSAWAACVDDGAGTITCSGTTDSADIGLVRGPNVLVNQGTILVPGLTNGIIAGGDSVVIQNIAGAAITSNGQGLTAITTILDRDIVIINAGVISQTNPNGIAAIRFSQSDSFYSARPTLTNTGRIESATTAIMTSAQVVNFTLNNTGIIIGATNGAIQVSGTNHTLNFGNGSLVDGIIFRMTPGVGLPGHGNDNGTDVVNLSGSGRFVGGFSGPFDRLTMNGGNWVLGQQPTNPAQFDVVSIDAGTFNLATGTLAVGTLATVAPGATLNIGELATLSGNAQISGTLIANGLSPSANVTVMGPSGLVSGIGTLGALNVLAGGTVAPGADLVGTLTSASYNAAPGSALRIALSGTQSGLMNVTGNATLGGTLQLYAPAGGAAPVVGTTYVVVQASSVTGTFSSVSQPFAFFTLTDRYTATQAQIVATQRPFNNPTATNNVPNLTTAAQAIDYHAAAPAPARNSDLNVIADQFLRLSPTAATAALHSISGESYAAFTTVALEQMDLFRATALDAAGACEAQGGLVVGRVCSWGEAVRLNGNLRGSGDLAGFDYSLTGVQAGAETRVTPSTVVGVTLGYGNQQLRNFQYASRSLSGDAVFLGVYGAQDFGPVQLVGLGGYSLFDNQATRNIAIGDVQRQANSSYGGQGLTAAAAMRYWSQWQGIRFAPEAIMAYGQYSQDGFTETGASSLNLRVQGTTTESLTSGVGIRADSTIPWAGTLLRPNLLLRYEHSWSGGARDDHQVTASFAEVPTSGSWTVYGQNRGVDAVIGRAGLIADIAPGLGVFGNITGQWRSTGYEWGGGLGLRATF